MLSAYFWKKNLACIKLGIRSKTAYPIDFIMGILIVPITYFLAESAFWAGLIHATGKSELAGFSVSHYISYFLWIMLQLGSINWIFERKMIAEINSGAVNALLLRPSSFFEHHLGQLLGQKLAV